jgi:hypothetical protein
MEAAPASRPAPTLSQLRRRAALWSRVINFVRMPRFDARSVKRMGPLRGFIAVLVVAWSVGAVLFLRADGSTRLRLPRTAQEPTGEHNLALHRWGPTLRASSYHREWFSQHHPIFLIDGREAPHEVEKWTSQLPDAAPWVEITWREPRQLSRVTIFHGGWRERASFTARRYRLWCLAEDGTRTHLLEVTDNHEAVASHSMACAGARGLRVAFERHAPDEQVRVYEIEAWGQ